jgi:hypothetical protein
LPQKLAKKALTSAISCFFDEIILIRELARKLLLHLLTPSCLTAGEAANLRERPLTRPENGAGVIRTVNNWQEICV